MPTGDKDAHENISYFLSKIINFLLIMTTVKYCFSFSTTAIILRRNCHEMDN